MPSGLSENLAKNAVYLRRSADIHSKRQADDHFHEYMQNTNNYCRALADAIDTALGQGIEDPVEIYRIAWRAQISSGGYAPTRYGGVIFRGRITNFDSPLFSSKERNILNALVSAYGEDVVVVADRENGDEWTLLILRPEFVHLFEAGQEYPISQYADSEYLFWVYRKFPGETDGMLVRALLRRIPEGNAELPRLHKALRSVLGEVQVIDDVRHIPVWEGRTTEITFYNDLPSFGERCEIEDLDALLEEGVVATLLGKNYRIWFDYTQIDEVDGAPWPPSGERLLRVQQTAAPVTTVPARKWAANTMLGHGRSQQMRGMSSFMDRPLYCLMVLNLDSYDSTHCIMVQLDDSGEIELAWVERSST
jgi:hypothetical protein